MRPYATFKPLSSLPLEVYEPSYGHWLEASKCRPREGYPFCVLGWRASDGLIDKINPNCVGEIWPYWMPLPSPPTIVTK